MNHSIQTLVVALVALAGALATAPASAQVCSDNRLAMQTLGSGGPFPSGRASSGYLIWFEGRSIALVDAGGGVFQTFGRADGRIEQLQLVALSHLHPDHVSDLPALLWLSEHRREPLPVAGPSGSALLPAVDVFLERLVGETGSALPVVFARGAPLRPIVVDVQQPEPTIVLENDELEVSALSVPHGGIPTAAFRIRVDGRTFVFGSDQNGTNPAFVEFARGADMLVMHLSLSPAATDTQLTTAHATPDVVGQVAAGAKPRGLVLSHVIIPRPGHPQAESFAGFDSETTAASVAAVRRHYGGTLVLAEDLQCVAIPD